MIFPIYFASETPHVIEETISISAGVVILEKSMMFTQAT